MTPKEYEAAAVKAAAEAGRVLRDRFRQAKAPAVRTKGLHDFVTDVDHEAERAAVGYVLRNFPDHAVLSEEASPDTKAGGFRWIIDPLDGTTNFIHGVTPFCVSVALEHETKLIAAAIYDPVHDEMFHASSGGGAFLNERPIHCSPATEPDLSLIATGFPFRELERLPQYLTSFEAFVRTTAGIRRAGSAAIDLAYTACGRYDGFWEIGLSAWDVAAGILIVREAGGKATDVLGGGTMLESGDILAAGSGLHDTLLNITRKAFGPQGP